VLPGGAAHTLTDDHASPATALDDVLADHPLDAERRLRYGGEGPLTRILCGGFSLAEGMPESTLALLPDVVRARRDHVDSTVSLEPVLAALTSEAESGRPGSSAIVAKIADVFLAHVLRSWLADADNGATGAELVSDPVVAKAVLALNARAAEPWSIDRLARRVACRGQRSRSGSAGSRASRRCDTWPRFGFRERSMAARSAAKVGSSSVCRQRGLLSSRLWKPVRG
jgi:Cupin